MHPAHQRSDPRRLWARVHIDMHACMHACVESGIPAALHRDGLSQRLKARTQARTHTTHTLVVSHTVKVLLFPSPPYSHLSTRTHLRTRLANPNQGARARCPGPHKRAHTRMHAHAHADELMTTVNAHQVNRAHPKSKR